MVGGGRGRGLSHPVFSVVSGCGSVLSPGMGVDLMVVAVGKPVTKYLRVPEGGGQTIGAARQVMVWTLFHYGLTGWSMYALMGMALGY
ncbi:BCCT family transporter, partial [Escherichia coli]|uniref:BCCT family transporter n=1 Tax=Escherichia coli TaxID=562 RepID=UPI002024BA14